MKPTIGIAAPADYLEDAFLDHTVSYLNGLGLNVDVAAQVTARHGRFGGQDAARADAVTQQSRTYSHVLFAAGGYGSNRILPLVDWRAIPQGTVWMGFSDTTSMLLARVAQTGVGGWHGPMGKQFGLDLKGPDMDAASAILQGKPPAGYDRDILKDATVMQKGKASGRLIGGNLAMVRSLLGTPYMPEPQDGDILFVEDICETNFRLDRDLEQLAQAGWFDKLGGLIFGRFSDIEESINKPFGFTVEEIFERHAARLARGPVVSNFPAGHKGTNLPLPIGSRVTLEAGDDGVVIHFEGVK